VYVDELKCDAMGWLLEIAEGRKQASAKVRCTGILGKKKESDLGD
jgi:hypothetical protein